MKTIARKVSALLFLLSATGACAPADEEPVASVGQAVSGSCDPALASGAVPAMHRALLDTIARAEGTKGYGEDGYNVRFSYVFMGGCDQHPASAPICSGGRNG